MGTGLVSACGAETHVSMCGVDTCVGVCPCVSVCGTGTCAPFQAVHFSALLPALEISWESLCHCEAQCLSLSVPNRF